MSGSQYIGVTPTRRGSVVYVGTPHHWGWKDLASKIRSGAGVRHSAVILMAVLYEISRWLTTLFSDEGNNAPLDIAVDAESRQFDHDTKAIRKYSPCVR
jgi:hypothetical protein